MWNKTVSRLLCVRLDGLGDLVMTTPALRAIKESSPQTDLTLLCSPAAAELAPMIPSVDRVLTFASPWVKTEANTSTVLSQQMIEKVRRYSFDGAIIFTVHSQSALPAALFTYMAGIPRRAAFNHENPYRLLTHWLPDPEPQVIERHEVERQIALVESLGYKASSKALKLEISPAAIEKVNRMLTRYRTRPHGYIVVHPGASDPRRRLSAQVMTGALQLIDWDGPIFVTGKSEEIGVACELNQLTHNRTISLVDKLSLQELVAILSQAALVITGNTGPAHLAAAVGTPLVDIYARTNLQHTPWGVESRVLFFDVPCVACERGVCSKRHGPKLKVKSEDIARAAQELLAKGRFNQFVIGKGAKGNSAHRVV